MDSFEGMFVIMIGMIKLFAKAVSGGCLCLIAGLAVVVGFVVGVVVCGAILF